MTTKFDIHHINARTTEEADVTLAWLGVEAACRARSLSELQTAYRTLTRAVSAACKAGVLTSPPTTTDDAVVPPPSDEAGWWAVIDEVVQRRSAGDLRTAMHALMRVERHATCKGDSHVYHVQDDTRGSHLGSGVHSRNAHKHPHRRHAQRG